MVNGGDLCLLNNVLPGFHISGVCSYICSFNRILRSIRMLLTRFDRDVTDSAANSTTFLTVSLSTLYRVWERDVSNAVHFGTLGHGRCGRYCVRLEIYFLACFVP